MIKDSREEFNMRSLERPIPQSPPSLDNKGVSFVTTAEKPVAAPRVPLETVPIELKPKPPEKHLGKKILFARLAGALFLIANAGVAFKHHTDYDVPLTPAGIAEDITTLPQEWQLLIRNGIKSISSIGQKEKEIPVPPIFDNTADHQFIQAGINAIPVSPEELPFLLKDTVKPIEKDKFPDVTILLPIALKDNQRVEIDTNWVDQAWNPIAQKPDRLAYGKKFTIAQRGTEIIMSFENAKVSIGTTIVRDKNYPSSFIVIFYGPDGTEYNLVIVSPQDIRQLQPTDLIKNALDDGRNDLTIPIGTPIVKTTVDNAVVEARMFAYPIGYPKNKRGIPVNYKLKQEEKNGKPSIAFVPQQSP